MRIGVLVMVVAFSLATSRAHACSCMQTTAAEVFAASDAVFEGRVLEVEQSEMHLRATMEVVQHWKGVESERVVVETGADSAMCGVAFEVGTSWLVYATREGEVLRTGLCERTARIEEAAADRAELGAGVVPVAITEEDEVEGPAEEPPARGGCASCAVGAPRGERPIACLLLALGVTVMVRARRREGRHAR